MKAWQDYKQTIRVEAPQFQYARAGALVALRALNLSRADIDAKNVKGYSPLMLAAYHGRAEVVRYLLTRGADANSADNDGSTVLMGAAFKGDIDVVRLLIEAGADIDAHNAKGQTAIDFAHMFGRADIARFLKTCQRKPDKFGVNDIVSGWLSFFFNKRRCAK